MTEKKAGKSQARDENTVKRAVIAKALKDPEFKAKLLKSPKATIEAEMGVTVPESITVTVVEDSASVVHLLLPCARPAERVRETGVPTGGEPEPINLKAPVVADGNKKRAALIEKALKDAEFKAQLLKNPKTLIEKSAEVKIPAGVTVKVLEDTAMIVHLVLPSSQSVFGN